MTNGIANCSDPILFSGSCSSLTGSAEATVYVQNKWLQIVGGVSSNCQPQLGFPVMSELGDDASSTFPYSDSSLSEGTMQASATPKPLTGFSLTEDVPLSSPLSCKASGTPCFISPSKAFLSRSFFETPLDEPLQSGASFSEYDQDDESATGGMTHSASLDNIVDMVLKAEKAISDDIPPELSLEGTSGTYFVKDMAEKRIGVFKPHDEEVSTEHNPRGYSDNVKTCIPPGESWKREIAAYRLDHAHFAGVPETFKMRMPAKYFHSGDVKVGSFQRFVKSDAEAWDVLPGKLPVDSVHRIAVLDIRLCNSDRHGGNVLVCRSEEGGRVSHLVPIDHGCCLPTNLTEIDFEWLMWSQAKQPVSEEIKTYIESLDEVGDETTLIRELGISAESAALSRAATFLLKEGTAAGLTLYDIGSLMRRPHIDLQSELEKITTESRLSLAEGATLDFTILEPLIVETVAACMEEKSKQI